jgi:hypothetical protein
MLFKKKPEEDPMDQKEIIQLKERVARGAAWLDRVTPGWADRINVGILNVGDYESCPLGQVIGEQASMNLCVGPWGLEHGFKLEGKKHWWGVSGAGIDAYLRLSQEWTFIIFERRALAKLNSNVPVGA